MFGGRIRLIIEMFGGRSIIVGDVEDIQVKVIGSHLTVFSMKM